VRAVPRLCELYPGICLTTDEKARKNISHAFFNLGAGWGWVVNVTPRPLYPRERPGNHCRGGWVGLRAGLDGCGKYRPHWDSIRYEKGSSDAFMPRTGTLRYGLDVWVTGFGARHYKRSPPLTSALIGSWSYPTFELPGLFP
jgi:hypothetical protein